MRHLVTLMTQTNIGKRAQYTLLDVLCRSSRDVKRERNIVVHTSVFQEPVILKNNPKHAPQIRLLVLLDRFRVVLPDNHISF